MKQLLFMLVALVAMGITLAFNFGPNNAAKQSESNIKTSKTSKTKTDMNNYISIFEIAANDMPRAIRFYENIWNLSIEPMEMAGMQMGLLPFEDQVIIGVIVQGEGYTPSAEGTTVYWNAGDNLQVILDRVEENGGKILVPKTPHADESGFFALFLDTEGNKMGLHSLN